ncbi:FLA1BP / FLA1-binding protein [Leishmania donovani]|uniref:Hypothetical_protein_conserved n=1 Tax=Leishmania donovani TaxID=5661 RepID=A0A504Y2V7_LEIDO|nr:hypothetical protein CGC20_35780 [Leishmania donovani]CAJ1986747.1 FLA1BP / FLA1-binding protein [Leishmania donovani]VDZ42643.1 hypothetical_protein_conserved [Leishmania donovani]
MGRCIRRVSSAAAAALLIALAAAAAVATTTARAYDHAGITVAGALLVGQNLQGKAGASRILNPFAICADFDTADVEDTTLLIGGASYFFSFNRYSTYLGFWYGQGSMNLNSGPIDKVRLTGVFGCVTLRPNSSNGLVTSTVYYVQNDGMLYWVSNSVVYLTQVKHGISFVDVTVHDNNVYLLSTQNGIYQCGIGAGGAVVGSACTQITLTGSTEFHQLIPISSDFRGFAVSSSGIFITPTSDLYWFNLSGAFIAKSVGVTFVDTKFTSSRDTANRGTSVLMAASTSAVYTVTTSDATISYALVSGKEVKSCNPALNNVDSDTSPTFCGIARIYPLSTDMVYMTTGGASVVRAIIVSNTTVSDTITRTPFPVYFLDNSSIMPLILDGMDYELVSNSNIPFPYVAINHSTPKVDDSTWDTIFSVDVSNRFFSTVSRAAVIGTPFMSSLHGLQAYYNRTNHILFGDPNVLPMCNLTKMQMIERAVAADARAALQYPYIYTSKAQNFTVNAHPNLTLLKLLMPYPFGEILNESGFFENTTTPASLANVHFNTTMLAAVRNAYTPDFVYDCIFAGNAFPFHILTAAQQQLVRWIIYTAIQEQLAKCAENSPSYTGSGSSSSDSHDDMVPGCVPRVGIDNLTELVMPGMPYSNYNITVFIPESLHYNFSISRCLDGTDWTNVTDYLQNATTTRTRKCGTGCIVSIAVVSAVVAAILVVAIVIATSKRRRLATVVAPALTVEPKFASTLDMGSEEGSRNPLNG